MLTLARRAGERSNTRTMVRKMGSADDGELLRGCSNWGRWGADDELGTLNYITDDKRRQAAQLVITGHTYPLGREIALGGEAGSQGGVFHRMTLGQGAAPSAHDFLAFGVHGFDMTHVDALGHTYLDGMAYNGRRQDQVLTAKGLQSCSVGAIGAGIFTRGILLDVADALGVGRLPQGFTIGAEQLGEAEVLAGAEVGEGDAVLVRSGVEPGGEDGHPGLDMGAVRWLSERKVALYGGDCIEYMPSGVPGLPMPLHQLGLVAMGLCLVDVVDVEALREACEREERREFLLVVAPLRLRGGTGSPVNPLAVF